MDRRNFLKGVLGFMVSQGVTANLPTLRRSPKTLILLELKGGNDGLNTIIPFTNPEYYRLRPNLAIPAKEVIKISDTLAFHPALESLQNSWNAGDLAIVQGLGYPEPNRSHFSSIDIWEAGSDSSYVEDVGWIARIHAQDPGILADNDLDTLVLGDANLGPFQKGQFESLVVQQRGNLFKRVSKLPGISKYREDVNPALDHILQIQEELKITSMKVQHSLDSAPTIQTQFPKTRLGQSLQMAARALAGGLRPGIIKITHTGFDTHASQLGKHRRLLEDLAGSLDAFRSSMVELKAWENVLIMTYSEFGRRVSENASRGTDHGTAAPHFLLGGRVKGGVFGDHPSLQDLDHGDLKHTQDYRAYYQGVSKLWWGSQARITPGQTWFPMDFLRS